MQLRPTSFDISFLHTSGCHLACLIGLAAELHSPSVCQIVFSGLHGVEPWVGSNLAFLGIFVLGFGFWGRFLGKDCGFKRRQGVLISVGSI